MGKIIFSLDKINSSSLSKNIINFIYKDYNKRNFVQEMNSWRLNGDIIILIFLKNVN